MNFKRVRNGVNSSVAGQDGVAGINSVGVDLASHLYFVVNFLYAR